MKARKARMSEIGKPQRMPLYRQGKLVGVVNTDFHWSSDEKKAFQQRQQEIQRIMATIA